MAYVLIVDEDETCSMPLARYLEQAGHAVACADGGRQGLAKLLDRLPDAVVLSLYMREMDGTAFLEVVRSYLKYVSLPVVLIAPAEENAMIERAKYLKINSVLLKGKATLADILNAVEQAAHTPPV